MDEAAKRKIEERAYELFIGRGGTHGYAMKDWLKAEREVLGKQQTVVPEVKKKAKKTAKKKTKKAPAKKKTAKKKA
ncbi:MAG: DUF2934 domain-containing protein [Chitinivibrionales bacterium]|nr:DUF2934 domain-containing protein [Chitinivibrionales bacterium]